jgi:Rad3-related DNA helicase
MIIKRTIIEQLGKIIGFDEAYIKSLNDEYQNAGQDRKFKILAILWDSFFKLLDELTWIKYKQYNTEILQGKRKFSSSLYQEAREEIKQFFLDILTGQLEEKEKLEELRQKIALWAKGN